MTKAQKKFLYIILVLSSIIILIWVIAPALIRRIIDSKIDKISLIKTSVQKGEIKLLIKINIPANSIPSFVDSTSYSAKLYDTSVAQGSKKFHTKSTDNSIIIPIKIHSRPFIKEIIKHEGEKTKANIHLINYCHLPLLGKTAIKINRTVDILLPIVPDVVMEDVQLIKFGLDNMMLNAKISIKNLNKVDFTISDIKYKAQVMDFAYASGVIHKKYHIKSSGTTFIEVPISVDLKHELKTVGKLIKGEHNFPYHLKADMNLNLSTADFNIFVEADKKGTINIKEGGEVIKDNKKVDIKKRIIH